jgi:surface carbohydrate biosynthesis protein (TIGR04326 family)
MKTVILCNQLGRLKAILKGIPGPLRYINLAETSESLRIGSYLRQMPDIHELPRSQLFRQRSEAFRKEYIEFMGQVNARHHSLHWWAMPFTNKNPVATNLCRNAFYFILIAELLRSDTELLLVIIDSLDLAAQVRVWAKQEGVRAIVSVRVPWTSKTFLKQYTPVGIIYAALRAFLIWILSRRYQPAPNVRDEHLVITTVTHTSSFATLYRYRDAFFGPLVEYLATTEHKALIFGLVLERPLEQLRKLRRLNFGLPVLPLESCLTLGSLVTCAFRAFGSYIRPVRLHGLVEMGGLDLSCLVKRAIREAQGSGNVFSSLRVYCCARQLARTVRVARCLYPYENRSWEKMLLLGIRSVSPQTQMVGYQHASIALIHTNFLLGVEEAKVTPLPDTILTTGEVVKRWLEREGNYLSGMLKVACALRQGQSSQTGVKKQGQRITRVLVALATSLGEYVNTLVFLGKAFASSNGYEVRIRPHPIISIEPALKIAPIPRRDFYSLSTGSLADDLQWADVVLYASTTVGLEAVSLGIPVIYLDLGDFLDTDPMFGWKEFKWSVKEPSELIKTIQCIEAIPEAQFQELQQKGQEYVSAYLKPFTVSSVRTFWGR